MRLLRPFIFRSRIEAASKDAAIYVAVVCLLSILAAVAAARRDPSSALNATLVVLAALWPLSASSAGALVAGRDAEVGLLEVSHALAIQAFPWRVLQVAVALALALSAVTCAVLAASVVAVTRGGSVSIGESGGTAMSGILMSAPLWVIIGVGAAAAARSRAGALGAVTICVVANLALEQLAAAAPSARALFASTPLGVQDLVDNGLSSRAMPELGAPVIPIAGAIITIAAAASAPETIRRWRARYSRQGEPRRGVAFVLVLTVASSAFVGTAGGPVLSEMLPWHLSPQWVLDRAVGRTPDHAVAELLRAHAEGDDAAAAAVALGGNPAQTLGQLATEFKTATEVEVLLEEFASVAGQVRVTWRSSLDGEPRRVLACTTRLASSWRVAFFVAVASCDPGG